MRAPPLRPGDTIGIMAPSSYVERDDIAAAQAIAEQAGYRIWVHPQTYARKGQSAGTHEEKLAALHELWADDSIRAVWAAGGGNRSLHLVDRIYYKLVATRPKHLIGFSDVTALLNAITAKTNLVTWHGPVFRMLPTCEEWPVFQRLVAGEAAEMDMSSARVLRTGEARGRLIGGNLAVFQYLVGTPFLPDLGGAILFLEDCNEELSRIDRMFLHLRWSGALQRISGLMLGSFEPVRDTGRPFGFTLQDIVEEHTRGLDIPIVMNAPFGHAKRLFPLPVGGVACLIAANPPAFHVLPA
ncbi:MAG: LD-carboxypeptidase [Alphaproteobacteria bacterium]|nr:LD-carboxypeptidase [Alphaproteobacteria bacterium]